MKIPFLNNSPIRKNMLANLFGVGVQLLNQIILVPFYILFWGNDLYSDWIVISALTTIFSMSDVGLNNVIQNRFAVKYTEGNFKECESLITNNIILILATLGITLFGIFLFVGVWDITEVMNLHILTRDIANCVFVLLVIKVFIGMLSSVQDAAYKSTHNASVATYMSQVGLLATALITLGCILLKTHVVILCILITLPQLVLIVIKFIHSQKYFAYKFSIKSFDYNLLKQIILPSLSFMSFPLGNTIVLQGFTLVVNNYFGANSVVLYNTTRTLCNFIKNFLGTLQTAVWPEYSIAYGKGDYNLMRHLHRKILKITIVVSLLMGGCMLVFGPIIYKLWTRDAVEFSYSLMAVYTLVLFTESLWTSSAVTLMATNNHSKLGSLYVISSGLALALAVFLVHISAQLWLVALALVFMHLVICIFTIREGFRFTKDSLFNLKAK